MSAVVNSEEVSIPSTLSVERQSPEPKTAPACGPMSATYQKDTLETKQELKPQISKKGILGRFVDRHIIGVLAGLGLLALISLFERR